MTVPRRWRLVLILGALLLAECAFAQGPRRPRWGRNAPTIDSIGDRGFVVVVSGGVLGVKSRHEEAWKELPAAVEGFGGGLTGEAGFRAYRGSFLFGGGVRGSFAVVGGTGKGPFIEQRTTTGEIVVAPTDITLLHREGRGGIFAEGGLQLPGLGSVRAIARVGIDLALFSDADGRIAPLAAGARLVDSAVDAAPDGYRATFGTSSGSTGGTIGAELLLEHELRGVWLRRRRGWFAVPLLQIGLRHDLARFGTTISDGTTAVRVGIGVVVRR